MDERSRLSFTNADATKGVVYLERHLERLVQQVFAPRGSIRALGETTPLPFVDERWLVAKVAERQCGVAYLPDGHPRRGDELRLALSFAELLMAAFDDDGTLPRVELCERFGENAPETFMRFHLATEDGKSLGEIHYAESAPLLSTRQTPPNGRARINPAVRAQIVGVVPPLDSVADGAQTEIADLRLRIGGRPFTYRLRVSEAKRGGGGQALVRFIIEEDNMEEIQSAIPMEVVIGSIEIAADDLLALRNGSIMECPLDGSASGVLKMGETSWATVQFKAEGQKLVMTVTKVLTLS